ncbi:MAG: transposase, partial [Cellvibrionaceae bacterium]|nr:transposase [Cellvibrionaceae bacterium]
MGIETLEITVVESSTVDTDSTIELLQTLNQKYPGANRLHIILDNALYHYSHLVKDYIKDNQRINLVFLPSYSPELNLIERVWRYFKKHV